MEQENQCVNDAQSTQLNDIKDRIAHAQEGIDAGNSALGILSNALTLDWWRDLATDLQGLMRRAIAINMATYRAIMTVQSALPGLLERRLVDEPFILEGPLRSNSPRTFTVHRLLGGFSCCA